MKQIRLSGSGGQGVITAAIILAEAAVNEGKEAVQSQSYGPEARGGASKSEVIIGSEPISYPKAVKPDLLLVLNQESFNKYAPSLKAGGTIIADSEFVDDAKKGDYTMIRLPITDLARTLVGREMVVNIVCLGIIQEVTGIVTSPSLEKAVLKRVPKGTESINTKALHVGQEAARKYLQEQTHA